jgi:hypothetical protein
MNYREDEEVYIFTRDFFVSNMRSRLTTATESATEAEQWARQFSRSLVRLLNYIHFISTNIMNVGES